MSYFKEQKIVHPFKPVYNSNSEILILGSFPSIVSREVNYYYGNKSNRFWRLISSIYNSQIPFSNFERESFLIENKIALYDVIYSCTITGSSDSSIKDVIPNNIVDILNNSNIKRIFTNGKLAYNLYNKYLKYSLEIEACYLPSTSAANAAWSFEKLKNEWTSKIII